MTRKKRLLIVLAIILAAIFVVAIVLAVLFTRNSNKPDDPNTEISGSEQGGTQGGSGSQSGGEQGGSQGGSGEQGGTQSGSGQGGSQGSGSDVHVHTMNKFEQQDATCTAEGKKAYWHCSGCNKNYLDKDGNQEAGDLTIPRLDHELQKHEAKEPTCIEDGNLLYYECTHCHGLFLDDTQKEPTTKTAVTQKATGHMAETEWEKDGTSHWHNCEVCGQMVPESAVAHSYDAKWETDAVAHWKECEICGYVNRSTHEFRENDLCSVCNYKQKSFSVGLEYTLNEDQISYSVTGIGSCKDADIVIPETYEEKPVTSIGRYAFAGCSGLTSVDIPDSVTSIGNYAFYECSGLTSVMIGSGVTSIGNDAFRDCSGLTAITIPNSVTSIGDDPFSGCSGLTEIKVDDNNRIYHSQENCLIETQSKTLIAGCKTSKIPDDGSVTSIGDWAFRYCGGLTSIVIPDSVISIGYQAFYECSGLTSVTIGSGVTSIGDYAFYECSGLTSVTIGSGVTSIGDEAFYGCSKLTSIDIPDSVTSIGNYAFRNCNGLTSIDIPDSVTSIGNYAFYECSGLTSVTIGSGVTSIGGAAFSGCYGLEKFEVAEKNPNYSSQDGILYNKAKTKFVYTPHAIKGAVVIPDGVTSIGNSQFYGRSGLTSIVIPDSVTSIGDWAFEGCSGLHTVRFKNPNEWKVSQKSDMSFAETVSGLNDPARAANYLTSTYYDYYWKRYE